jgi:hypothetical protein
LGCSSFAGVGDGATNGLKAGAMDAEAEEEGDKGFTRE